MATRDSPTSPASSASPSPSGGFSSPTPTANAAALAEWPDGSEFDVGIRRPCRASGTERRFGRGRFQTRLATWLVNRLVTARVTTPRAAPRRDARCPDRGQRGGDDQPQLRMVGGPGQPWHRGVEQRTGRFRDGLEHLAVQGAQALADLPDSA